MKREIARRYPIGAELIANGRTHFRIWAPKVKRLSLVLEDGSAPKAKRTFHPLDREEGGYFSGQPKREQARSIDFGSTIMRIFIPIRRRVINRTVAWLIVHCRSNDASVDRLKWRGRKLKVHIIYEMHIGTFTPEGTWRAAARELAELARIGITVIEMMPIADFPGEFRLGLRWSGFRASPSIRLARRPPGVCRPGPPVRLHGDSRCGLQPSRAGR